MFDKYFNKPLSKIVFENCALCFVKQKSIGNDDAFFNRNWAGACGGRLAGPGLLAGWATGFWIV